MKTSGDIEKDKLRQHKKKLVSNARAILTNQTGLPLGVQKMVKIVKWIEHIQPLDVDVEVFNDYYSKTAGIPIGTERLEWNIEALKKEDRKLHKLAEVYKDRILEKCSELIKAYGSDITNP